MGLKDRDYLRSNQGGRPPLRFPELVRRRWWQRINLATAIPIALSVIALISAGLWLYRDARTTFADDGPVKGSLLVNVNTASYEELQTLPGIGPARARLIIEHRPYEGLDDLKRVGGLPESVIDGSAPLILFTGDTQEVSGDRAR